MQPPNSMMLTKVRLSFSWVGLYALYLAWQSLNPAVAKLHAAYLSFGVTAAED